SCVPSRPQSARRTRNGAVIAPIISMLLPRSPQRHPMRNRWNDADAGLCSGDLEACVYASRLLGAEPALLLYGGGNTSVKISAGGEYLLYVKGSGADLAQVQAHDFTSVRLGAVQRLI